MQLNCCCWLSAHIAQLLLLSSRHDAGPIAQHRNSCRDAVACRD